MFLTRKVFQSLRNYSKTTEDAVYILSAVRTPIGLFKGALNDFTAPHLFSFVFNEALQRALVPPADVLNVFLKCSSLPHIQKDIIKRSGLSEDVNLTLTPASAMESFINAAKFLPESEQNVCLVGGVVSMSNHETEGNTLRHYQEQNDLNELLELDCKNFKNAKENGKFHDEILKIIFRMKGKQILVSEDELLEFSENFKKAQSGFKYSLTPADGAVAFVLAAEGYIQKNHLTPVAKIISFAEEPLNSSGISSAQLAAIKKALQVGECQSSEIAQWELDSAVSNMHPTLLNHFGVDPSTVNRDGGVLSLGYPTGLSGAKALCHLTHSLAYGEFGCAVSWDFGDSMSAVVVQKWGVKISGKPRLSLLTKKPCPLCDDLKEQLKPFESRFSLNEVDIEGEGNAALEGLYKHDIPVLFLEGRFLCKHKLDGRHLDRRLSEVEDFH